jgi:AcrR family transcriptional regulator
VAVESLRVTFRRQVREHALDVTYRMTAELGWDRVRVADVAAAAGISRPTLYREFGNKDGLGDALVMREVTGFLARTTEVLDRHRDNLPLAIREAVLFVMREAKNNSLLRSVMTVSPDQGLLPLFNRAEPMLASMRMLRGWFAVNFPRLDQKLVGDAIDSVVRLIVSHLLLPLDDPRETAVRLTRLAIRYLELPEC